MPELFTILRTEWLKLRNYKTFWLLLISYPLSLGGIVLLALWGQSKAQSTAGASAVGLGLDSSLPLGFPQVWHNLSYLVSWLYFIPVLLVLLSVTNEFSFRTHRQNLLEGWSRTTFLKAKFLLLLVLSAFCTVNALLFSLLAGFVSQTPFSLEGAHYPALLCLQTSLYLTLALLLGFFVRRAAPAIALFFLYSLIFENVLSFLLNLNIKGLGSYLPLNVAGGLVPLPYYKEHAPAAAKALFLEPPETVLIAATVSYLLIFAGIMWYRFSREDL